MTNTKWLRQALLGSVALGVMATGAQADELSELKAQLESLQNRVDQMEQHPSQAALPEGASFLTLTRGSAQLPNYGTQAARDAINMPADRGFTIAVTPTADLPAPIAEVVVYGYVKGDVIYDFDGLDADTFTLGALWSRGDKDEHVRVHAFQSRFGIRSRTDTAIGQIRTQIEGDFYGNFSDTTGHLRLRHAYGEWDMTPNWTFLAGQTWRTAVLLPIGVPTIDFHGSAGLAGFNRAGQVRMTYHSGPISWAVAIEAPTVTSEADWPTLSSYIQFDAPGGHQFIATGTVAHQDDELFLDGDRLHDDDLSWAVQAGANVNLADIATLTVGGLYGEGNATCLYFSQDPFCRGGAVTHGGTFTVDDGTFFLVDAGNFSAGESWGLMAGLSFGLTDTTTFNVQYGITDMENDAGLGSIDSLRTQTVHANILWRPVQQMQLGWEIMWGEYEFDGGDFDRFDTVDGGEVRGGRSDEDALRAQFGAWFFF